MILMTIHALRQLNAARAAARKMVDDELHEHGYDSLRFADYRAGWLSLENQLDDLMTDVRIFVPFDEPIDVR